MLLLHCMYNLSMCSVSKSLPKQWLLKRYTCVTPVIPHRLDCVICAGKWPEHPRAYLKAKAAMGCQLADELASGFGLHAHPSEHCIDVLADGLAFRIFLASERCAA